ncbi:sensor histidine kinase [Limnohabitans sp. JirII-31]|uniref:sensor histidine kinase n=1 Tax=Limnohabitans sp. JirII-31 TaxID=1977908 RepID=UPI000C1E4C78|nr:sensor histidine kinase [Limnohabitans sp. JirII-31]PIT78384.1 histidine kinase [Limnohabitans sp. JirII-31]
MSIERLTVKPSLRNRLLRHVLLPLALTWLVGSALVVGIATYFTQQAYDRALLDDAYLVASHVRRNADVSMGGLELSLSAQEMSTVLFDQSESLYFAVLRPDGSLVAGHTGLPGKLGTTGQPVFDTLDYQNRSLRSVTIHREQPVDFYVVMAQTTTSRDRLLQRLLAFSIAPQILLLIGLALWLQRAIETDLHPLAELTRLVGKRDARDLTPVPVSGSTRDVQRLGQAVNALLTRIAQSVQAQREFSGNVAHELRTPLAGIRALADYGLRHTDPQVWREQLQGIAQSQERASHLVDQLLALALADEAQQSLVREPVALDVLVGEAVLRFLPRADAAGVDLGARGVEQAVQVMGGAALIEGVLNNLLDNALRYGRAPEGESHITVAVHEAPQAVVLSVSDNGPGVSAAQMQQLTKRWVQGSAGEALKEGSGLGLAIVSEYARLLGAQVSMQGETPSGLRVSLTFLKTPSA